MRTLGFSFLVFLIALVSGVFGHHMLTTGSENSAIVGFAIGAVLTASLCVAIVIAAKKEQKLALRVLAALVLIAGGCLLPDVRSAFLPLGYKVVSIVTGSVPFVFGIIILITLRKGPNQSPDPTRSARGSS